LSAVPVAHFRLVVPFEERESVNVAAFESRSEVTTTWKSSALFVTTSRLAAVCNVGSIDVIAASSQVE
jgi:hypothetical protein